ncbi:MAG TPA: GrpB family protein [Candidatus Limnocylindria bacterium]
MEHIGSTSVAGLAAKPVIDIDVVVDRPDFEAAINALEQRGLPASWRHGHRRPPCALFLLAILRTAGFTDAELAAMTEANRPVER